MYKSIKLQMAELVVRRNELRQELWKIEEEIKKLSEKQ